LLEAGDFVGLQKLPKNASPVRLHNRCKLQVDQRHASIGVSRVTFREMANNGLIPGVKKSQLVKN
jgi:small subunit ribosomal protein S14